MVLVAEKQETLKCPDCGGTEFRKIGFFFRQGKKIQRWQCTTCGKTISDDGITSLKK
jgi:transposase-like protein